MRSQIALAAILLAPSLAAADPTAGVDTALFRVSYDANGLFALEGARLLPKRDLSFKLFGGYAPSPLDAAIPGIGDGGNDRILDFAATVDMAFGMTLTDNIAIGISRQTKSRRVLRTLMVIPFPMKLRLNGKLDE